MSLVIILTIFAVVGLFAFMTMRFAKVEGQVRVLRDVNLELKRQLLEIGDDRHADRMRIYELEAILEERAVHQPSPYEMAYVFKSLGMAVPPEIQQQVDDRDNTLNEILADLEAGE